MHLIESQKNKIQNILLAIFCVVIGTLSGVLTLWLCIIFKLAIFGFNIGFIISPIIAGYVETFAANRIYGQTTGAISALITFIITVLYGFIFINTSLGFNVITIGSAGVILQATFPILINYIVIVVIFGIIGYLFGIFKNITNYLYIPLKKLYYKIIRKKYVEEKGKMDYDKNQDRININDLGILFLSTANPENKKIKKFNGIYEGKILIKSQKNLINSKPSEKEATLLKNLQKAREQALLNLSEYAKKDGCNAILDLTIEFDTLGGLKEDNIHIVARGTGVNLL